MGKRVLIVTDGTQSIQVIAQSITAALTGCKVKVCTAETFDTTELLPVDVFFLGCENPNPASFSYLSQLLQHINLALKSCGIFSTSGKALKYLDTLVKSCEAAVGDGLLVDGAVKLAVLKKWLKGVMQ
ncbi:MAG: hypothetical protein FWG99_01655 [Treponema sp.]|nr:hypothetical protein [Treponema sp.]